MDAVFYSLAFNGSEAPLVQLARSLESLRTFDHDLPVFVFVFGEPPVRFAEVVQQLNARFQPLGDHRAYIARTEPERGELFSLDPKIHRWLVLDEPELKACERMLYIDSDTFFLSPPRRLFDGYRGADLFAREEPFSRRSVLGYKPSYLDEEAIAELRRCDGLTNVPPFNTGVCLFNRKMADAITMSVPRYFDYLFRFLSWFHHHPEPGALGEDMSTARALHDRFLGPAAEQALKYPSQNRWIVDQVALWLALGEFSDLRFADFAPSDVRQGGEALQLSPATRRPILCHYFGHNTGRFFELLDGLAKASR
jgi:hypothetical protein